MRHWEGLIDGGDSRIAEEREPRTIPVGSHTRTQTAAIRLPPTMELSSWAAVFFGVPTGFIRTPRFECWPSAIFSEDYRTTVSRSTTRSRSSTACTEKTFFARSIPAVVIR